MVNGKFDKSRVEKRKNSVKNENFGGIISDDEEDDLFCDESSQSAVSNEKCEKYQYDKSNRTDSGRFSKQREDLYLGTVTWGI